MDSDIVLERREQEETNFRKLFTVVLDATIQKHNLSELIIEEAIESMIESFKDFTFSSVDFKLPENLCAYLFRYSTTGSGLTRFRVFEALKNCKALASSFESTYLKIVSLGGRPGNDIIGLCSALHECQNEKHKRFDITVVDIFKEWSAYLQHVNSILGTKENFGNVSEQFHQNYVTMNFLLWSHDPTEKEKYFQCLQEADVILISRLFSILRFRSVFDIIHNLYQNVKEGALILYIDSPNATIQEELEKYFHFLYTPPEESEEYNLLIEPEERFNFEESPQSKAQISVLCKKVKTEEKTE